MLYLQKALQSPSAQSIRDWAQFSFLREYTGLFIKQMNEHNNDSLHNIYFLSSWLCEPMYVNQIV